MQAEEGDLAQGDVTTPKQSIFSNWYARHLNTLSA